MKFRYLLGLFYLGSSTAIAVETYIAERLNVPPGTNLFFVHDINDTGEIVGTEILDLGNGEFRYQGVYWSDPQTFNALIQTPDMTNSFARAINNNGQITGHFSLRDSTGVETTSIPVWDRLSSLSLTTVNGIEGVYANDINDLGEIVGTAKVSNVDNSTDDFAFYFSAPSNFQIVLPNYPGSTASFINNNSEISGQLSIDNGYLLSNNNLQQFNFNPWGMDERGYIVGVDVNHNSYIFDPLNGTSSSLYSRFTYDINSSGSIVSSQITGGLLETILRFDGISYDIRSLTQFAGAEANFYEPIRINENGQILMRGGYFENNEPAWFLLTPTGEQYLEPTLNTMAWNNGFGSGSYWAGVSAGDFDGDGARGEVVIARNSDAKFFVYEYDTSANATAYTSNINYLYNYGGAGSASLWADIDVGDFDGDGRDELASVRNFDGNFYLYEPTTSGFLGVPGGSYTGYGSGSQWAGIASGDFDADGVDEIAAVRNYDGHFTIMQYSGSAMSGTPNGTYNTGKTNWRDVAAGDVDNDGADEAILVNYSGEIYIAKYSQGALQTPRLLFDSGSRYSDVTVADFNGDGIENEIVVLEKESGWFYVFRYIDSTLSRLGRFQLAASNFSRASALGNMRASGQNFDSLIVAMNSNSNASYFIYDLGIAR